MPRMIGSRTQIVDASSGPEIRIRAPKNWWPIIFLPVWILGWTAGGIFALREFVAGSEPRLFLGLWLVGWLGGELLAILTWSWMVFGREVLSVRQGLFTIGREVGRFAIKRRYPLHEISNLRASGWFGSPFLKSGSLQYWGLSGGTIAFDRKGKSVRFGLSLEEPEARAVVNELALYVRPNA